jgi:predicted enzyme related to lactoylglutathione lyase
VEPYIRNVTFECQDPARLAAFWAAVLGWEVEPVPRHQAELLEIERGPSALEDTVTLVDPAGVEFRLYFQRVDQPERGRASRVHFDLTVEDSEAEVDRLLALGAHDPVWREDRLGPLVERWVELQDPEGNLFTMYTEGATELP